MTFSPGPGPHARQIKSKFDEIEHQLRINIDCVKRDHPEGPVVNGQRLENPIGHSQELLVGHVFDRLKELKTLIAKLETSSIAAASSFKSAMRIMTSTEVVQYLLANTRYRGNGAVKAHRHSNLTKAYVAACRGCDPDLVRHRFQDDYNAVHDLTAEELTDRLDEVIGFDIDGQIDDAIAEAFFNKFHEIALRALHMEVSVAA